MPKVIVREIDNTKAIVDTYANFSVAVPGYVADSTKFSKVADDNGVYECSTIADFKEYIGCVADSEATKETPASYDSVSYAGEESTTRNTLSAFKALLGAGMFLCIKSEEETTGAGYLDDGKQKYTLLEEADFIETATTGQKDADGNDIPLWTKVISSDGKIEAYYNNVDIYVFESREDLGSDAAGVDIIGNRFAYMLVDLGYTILYKKMEKEEDLTQEDFWSCFKDRSMYDFRYICSGGRTDESIIDRMLAVVGRYNDSTETNPATDPSAPNENVLAGRGDATVLVDVNESKISASAGQSAIIAGIQAWVESNSSHFLVSGHDCGKYAAIFAPRVKINASKVAAYGDTTATVDLTIPASLYYLACAAKASENYAEWYGVAGYQRGICGYTVLGTTLPLGDLAVQRLEPRTSWNDASVCRSVNVITKIRSSGSAGYYLWGSRTAHALQSAATGDLVASHFLNIRQLCSTLKKDIYIACKQLTFSPNDALLWIDFQDKIRPTLERMKGDRGIKDYKMVKVNVSKKALMKAKIKIVPIEPVEDFNVGVYLEDSIDGLNATTTESEE